MNARLISLAVASIVSSLVTQRLIRKENQQLRNGQKVLSSALEKRTNDVNFLVKKLEENGIALDEFEWIVLHQQF